MRSGRVTTRETGTVRGTARRPHFFLAVISVTVQLRIQVFWVRSVYFNVKNILPKSGIFPPGHLVGIQPKIYKILGVLHILDTQFTQIHTTAFNYFSIAC